ATFYDKGSLAVYVTKGSAKARVGMIYYSTDDLGSLGNGSRQHFEDDLVSAQTVGDGKLFDAGEPSERVWCGTSMVSGGAETVCAWTGPLTSGVVMSTNPKDKPAMLADVLHRFRLLLDVPQ